jgi:WD40 repeat protein/serine/threonine protein kinase/tetratricopeptide (TPR) repeat protein
VSEENPGSDDDLSFSVQYRIDKVCNKFEAQWKAGAQPRIETCIDEFPKSERPALLLELIALEIEFRRKRGENLSPGEYHARFPGYRESVDAAFHESAVSREARPKWSKPQAGVDRNLLFGILALQNNFIDRDALVSAFNSWITEKGRPLGKILHERGSLARDELALLEALVSKHLERFGNDPQKSLASLSSIGSVRDDLERVADDDLHKSLAAVAEDRANLVDPGATAASPSVGEATSIGTRFRILRHHAKGGLGEVSVALDTELNRDVALKRIQEQFADDPRYRAHFVYEAEVTGGLEHPGIVPVYGLGQTAEGRPFYAMRFIKGDSLKDAVKRFHEAEKSHGRDRGKSTLELRELLGRFIDVCDAVAYAHSRHVLHRDLKPGNIMLGKYGETLVVDWGLAKALGRREAEPATDTGQPEPPLKPPSGSSLEQTVAGTAVGTPPYMSPEQVDSRVAGPATVRSDVYCLGATLYHVLTGHAPCEAEHTGEVFQKVLKGEIPRPRSLNPRLAPSLEAICLKALALSPNDRYPSARGLAEDIERWLADEPVEAHRESRAERVARWMRHHRALTRAAAAALVAIALVATGAAILINREWGRTSIAEANEHAQKLLASKEKAAREVAELERKAAMLREKQAKSDREVAELKRQRSEALRIAQEAGTARAERFHQKEALLLAQALTISDDPDLRQQWMVAVQSALAPVARTSRRSSIFGRLAYSPDHRYLVSGEYLNGAIRVWRTGDWVEERVLSGHSLPKEDFGVPTVTGLAFDPNKADELISAGQDGTIRRWNVATGSELMKSAPENNNQPPVLLCLAVSPETDSNGMRKIVTGDSKGKLRFWDSRSFRQIKPDVDANEGNLNAVRFRPGGHEFATAGQGKRVRLWDPDGGHLADLGVPVTEPKDEFGILDLAYSPDGAQLAGAGSNGHIYIWDASSRHLAHDLLGNYSGLPGPQGFVSKLGYGGPRKLFSAGGDGLIKEWDAAAGRLVSMPGRHDSNVIGTAVIRGFVVSPDGNELASGGADLSLRIWDARDGRAVAWLEGNAGAYGGASSFSRAVNAFAPDKHLLVTAGRGADAFMRSWDTRTLRERRTYKDLPTIPQPFIFDRITALAIHPDGSRFISADPNGDFMIWDVESGRRLRTIAKAHRPLTDREIAARAGQTNPDTAPAKDLINIFKGVLFTVIRLAWNHGGDRVASLGVDGKLRIWDPDSGRLVDEWDAEDPQSRLEGKAKSRAERQAKLRFIGPNSGGEVEPAILQFDPTDSFVIAGGTDGVIRFWELKSKKIADRLRLHEAALCAGTISADGRWLASGSEDGVIVTWDLQTRRLRRMTSLRPLLHPRFDARFVPASEVTKDSLDMGAEMRAGRAMSLAFSPDAAWLAVVLGDGTIALLDTSSGRVISRAVGHDFGAMGSCAVSAYFTEESELFTVGGDGRITVWELGASSNAPRIVPAVMVSPSSAASKELGTVVFVEPNVCSFNQRTGRVWLERLSESADPVAIVATGRSDGKVALGTIKGGVFVWDALRHAEVARLNKPAVPPKPASVPSSRTITWGPSGTLLNPATAALAVQPDGPLGAVAWRDERVGLFRITDGSWAGTLIDGGVDVASLAFSPDGRWLAVAAENGTLAIWDVEAGKLLLQGLQGPESTTLLCFSPDGRYLAQGGTLRKFFVWNPATGKLERTVEWTESGEIRDLHNLENRYFLTGGAYSADGNSLATCSSDGAVQLWDAKSYKRVGAIATRRIRFDASRAWLSMGTASGLRAQAVPKEVTEALATDPRVGLVPARLAFTRDSAKLIVKRGTNLWIYDREAVLAAFQQPADNLLRTTETLTGLELRESEVYPADHTRLTRHGESLRRDYIDTSPRRAKMLADAHAAVQAGDDIAAKKHFEEFLAAPGVFRAHEMFARASLVGIHFRALDLPKAEEEARKALAVDPGNVDIRSNLGILLMADWRFEEARDHFERLLKDPGLSAIEEPGVVTALAMRRFAIGELAQAEAELRAVLDRKPEAELERIARLQDPRSVVGRMVLHNGRSSNIVWLLGTVHLKQRRFNLALQDMEKVLHDSDLPADTESGLRANMAMLRFEICEFEKADAEITRCLNAAKSNFSILAVRTAQANLDIYRGKNLDQAASHFREASKKFPGNLNYQASLGLALVKNGDVAGGFEILNRVKSNQIVAQDPAFWDNLGDVYKAQRKPEEAREAWSKALAVFPKTAEAGDRRKAEIEKKLADLAR